MRTWIDCVLQHGNTSTNGVESGHGKLMKYLNTSMGHLAKCWISISLRYKEL